MDKLNAKYSLSSKALPPQRIRMDIGGWGGSPEKMEDGSEAQPWHCMPFTEGATYGLELLYQYETECHVINDNGMVRFEWDFAREPNAELTGGEFVTFFPKENTKYYLFNTRMDLQAPPGHVIRTEPHPRFFTDDTGTVPIAICGHVQTEWWPKKFFVVFKVPPPGQRHVFRKGEPFVQILFVPHRQAYEATPMTAEDDAKRRELERDVLRSASNIAKNVWHNSSGYELNDHYKILARAFGREGPSAVEGTIREGMRHHDAALPTDKTIRECLDLGYQRLTASQYAEARSIFLHVLKRDPNNAEAVGRLGIVAACMGSPMVAIKMMQQAVALDPRVAAAHSNLGEMLRRVGRHQDAEAAFRSSLRLEPNDPQVLSNLGVALAQQGKTAEGLEACRAALRMGSQPAVVHLRMGTILAQQRQYGEARAQYESALALIPGWEEARRALQQLPTGT